MFDRRNPQAASAPSPRPLPLSMEGREASDTALLSIVGSRARIEGTFEIADSIQIECEIGGELRVGGRLVIGRDGVVHADVHTVDAIIMGQFEGRLTATGDVEITETGRVSGHLQTDSLVIAKGGSFNGNVVKMAGAAHERMAAVAPDAVGRYEPPADAGELRDADADSGGNDLVTTESSAGGPTVADGAPSVAGAGARSDGGRTNHQNGRHNGKGGRNNRDFRQGPPRFPGGEANGSA